MMHVARRCLILVAIAATQLSPLSTAAVKRAGAPLPQRAPAGDGAVPEDPICNFDFLNYKYRVSDHTARTTGIPPEVALRNGQASLVSANGKNVDIGITKIIYGELTGDNAYEAVVRMSTVIVGTEYGTDDLYVFRSSSGTPVLLGIISEYDMDSAYREKFPVGDLSHGLTGVRIHDRFLDIEKSVEGDVNKPKHNVRLSFRYEGGKFVLAGVIATVPYRELP